MAFRKSWSELMQDPLGGRNSVYSSELRIIEQEVNDCEKCEGTGVSRKVARNKMSTILKNPERQEKMEAKWSRTFRIKSAEHAKAKKENPLNSSYGKCSCRIRADLKREILISNMPMSMIGTRYSDIIERDVNVHGQRVTAKAFAKHYPNKFKKAREDSIGCNFFGGYGRGKTFVAQVIAYHIAKKRYSVHYIPFYALVDLITSTTPSDYMFREIMNTDLLVIDDIGNEQKHRRRACGELAYSLDKRRERNKPTFFIFNEALKRTEILEAYDSAFYQVCTKTNMDVFFRTSVSDEKTSKARITKLNRTLG
jgi:DNA replication protein DnaC